MRWIPLVAIFLYVYIEISIFIQVAHVLGVLLTLILVIFTSVIGMSLVRNQGFKNFLLMQQKMAAGESPAAEMIKSVSLIIGGILLIIPGFFTDFLRFCREGKRSAIRRLHCTPLRQEPPQPRQHYNGVQTLPSHHRQQQ